MKKTGKTLISVAIAALLVLCVLSTTAFAAAAPSVSASTDSAEPGQTVSFTITTNNPTVLANVAPEGPLTYVSGPEGAMDGTDHNFITFNNPTVTYTYQVNADAAPGSAYSFVVSDIVVADLDGAEENLGAISAGGSVPAPPAPEEPAPAPEEPAPVVSTGENKYATITLPAGTTYYTMVNGAPGASHTLSKATDVSVIEKMPNGYTKIMIGTTTYLIKSSNATSSKAATTKLDKAPKTADATTTTWVLAIIAIAAAAAAGLYAFKKAAVK